MSRVASGWRVIPLLVARNWWCLGVGLAVSWCLGGGPRAHAQSAPSGHVLIVTGAPGEPRFAESFSASARAIRDAASATGASTRVLSGSSAMTDADGRATRESLSQAVAELGRTSSEGDVVSIILIGHGSAGEGARFNVTGPDVSASEFAGWLRPLEGRRLTIVVATSASGEWIPALAAPGRIVVTATRTAFERNESVFHSKFAEAFDGDAADADKDGRVSILEAFNHAAREVQREYESSGRLQTEHALLDDDGNGEGSSDPNPGAGDGRLASRTYIGADPVVASTVPGADALLRERARLEQSVEALRARRDSMDASEYERVLERLVTRLAEIRRSLEPPEAES